MNIIHITFEGPLDIQTLKEFREQAEAEFEDIDAKVVITDDCIEMRELPSIDDYIDELAEAMLDKMEERELRK